MKLYFIRHAIAMDRAEWSDDDLLRPLTDKGRKRARQAFEGLSRVADEPDIIFTSRATRAVQTAEILNKAFPGARLEQTELLNPGAGLEDLRLLLHQNDMESRIAALVGHEPDFSEMISGLLQGRSETNGNDFRDLHLAVKKASFVEIELFGSALAGELSQFISPSVLRKLAE